VQAENADVKKLGYTPGASATGKMWRSGTPLAIPGTVAINAVIAWHIMVMTLLGRQIPECDQQLMFTDAEPGNRIMWHDQTRLASAALGHGIGFQAGRRHALREPQ